MNQGKTINYHHLGFWIKICQYRELMLALTTAGTIEHKQLGVDLWSIKHNKLKASNLYCTCDKFLQTGKLWWWVANLFANTGSLGQLKRLTNLSIIINYLWWAQETGGFSYKVSNWYLQWRYEWWIYFYNWPGLDWTAPDRNLGWPTWTCQLTSLVWDDQHIFTAMLAGTSRPL